MSKKNKKNKKDKDSKEKKGKAKAKKNGKSAKANGKNGKNTNGSKNSTYSMPDTSASGSYSKESDSEAESGEKAAAIEYARRHRSNYTSNYLRFRRKIRSAKGVKAIRELTEKYVKGYKRFRKEAYDKKGKPKIKEPSYTPSPPKPAKGLMTNGELEAIIEASQPTREEIELRAMLADVKIYAPEQYDTIESRLTAEPSNEKRLEILKGKLRPADYNQIAYRVYIGELKGAKENILQTAYMVAQNLFGFLGAGSTRKKVSKRIQSGEFEGKVVTIGVNGSVQKENSWDYIGKRIENFLPAPHGWMDVDKAADQVAKFVKALYKAGIAGYNIVDHSLGGAIVAAYDNKYVKGGKLNAPLKVVDLGAVGHIRQPSCVEGAPPQHNPDYVSIMGGNDLVLELTGWDPRTAPIAPGAENIKADNLGHTGLLYHNAMPKVIGAALNKGPSQQHRATHITAAPWKYQHSYNDPDARLDKTRVNTPAEVIHLQKLHSQKKIDKAA